MINTLPTRYQAAIMRGDEILLIKHREHAGHAYWLFPGGGRETGETEIECVQREIREETNLEVEVQDLILDEVAQQKDSDTYKRYKTYLCQPLGNEPSPGYEPEPEVSAIYAIVEVGWFNLKDESTWNELILQDSITLSGLRRVRKALEEKASMSRNV